MLESEERHRALLDQISRVVWDPVARIWRSRVTPTGDWDRGWVSAAPAIGRIVTAGQAAAANAGLVSVTASLAEQGMVVDAVAGVVPRAFAGSMASGSELSSGLGTSVRSAKLASLRGSSARAAVDAGEGWLEQLIRSEIEAASKSAAQSAVAVRPKARYTRVASNPCCAACALAAGGSYRASVAFLRHPGCQCLHRLITGDGDRAPDVHQLVDSGVVDLTGPQAAAIGRGGDAAQVLRPAGRKLTTLEGATTRSWAGTIRSEIKRQGGDVSGPRLTPDGIFSVARSDAEVRRLLAANGYIVGNVAEVARAARAIP